MFKRIDDAENVTDKSGRTLDFFTVTRQTLGEGPRARRAITEEIRISKPPADVTLVVPR